MVNQSVNWVADSSEPSNSNYLVIIQQWWTDLNGKDVSLVVQEVTTPAYNVVSKTPQRFTIENPRMEDAKLYWREIGFGNDSWVTAKQLYLDRSNNQLKIVCQEPTERLYEFKVIG